MRVYANARQQVVSAVLAVCGAVALGSAAIAQNAHAEQNAPTEEAAPATPTDAVSVAAEARELVNRTVGRSPSTASRTEEVSIGEEVSYSDLDFKKQADVDEFNRRVREAAEESCAELDRLFPGTRSSRRTRECVNRAISASSAQVAAVIARGGGRYGGNAGQP